jgi:hypothetical protein
MKRSGEKILADIDATLDQLIQNADAIRRISGYSLEENELEALQKTQESLLARIMHMDTLLDSDQKKQQIKKKADTYHNIQQKISQFGRLNERLIKDVAEKFGAKKKKKAAMKKPRIGRNRKKPKVCAFISKV